MPQIACVCMCVRVCACVRVRACVRALVGAVQKVNCTEVDSRPLVVPHAITQYYNMALMNSLVFLLIIHQRGNCIFNKPPVSTNANGLKCSTISKLKNNELL